jgi:hypothetical protein
MKLLYHLKGRAEIEGVWEEDAKKIFGLYIEKVTRE